MQTRTVRFYRLREPGTTNAGSWVVSDEPSDTLCIGIKLTDGTYKQYDSYEAYHADGWATGEGLELETFDAEVSLPE